MKRRTDRPDRPVAVEATAGGFQVTPAGGGGSSAGNAPPVLTAARGSKLRPGYKSLSLWSFGFVEPVFQAVGFMPSQKLQN